MSSYIFETVELSKRHPASVFVTSIDKSSFHCHHEYEFILVLKGSLFLTTTPRHTELAAGDIALVNTNTVHELRKTGSENLCLFVQINPHVFTENFETNRTYFFYLNSQNPDMKPSKDFSVFTRTLAKIGLSYECDDIVSFHRTRALLYTLIADLFEYTHYDIYQRPHHAQGQNNSELLMKIIEYVQKNLNKEDLIEALCHDLGMSQKTVYRFLKNNVGLTLKDLIDANRIESAKLALKLSQKSIGVIADECGFGSENTFYRAFKNETGMTPLDYRKNGMDYDSNPEVKGYMNFSQTEARRLLENMI